MARSSRSLAVLLLVAIGGVVGWAFREAWTDWRDGEDGSHDSASQDDAADEPEPEVAVTTAAATAGSLPVTIDVVGEVRASPTALRPITSRASGRIAEVLARPGERVASGAPLVRFDRAPLALAVARARASAAAAHNALAEFDRGGRDQHEAEFASAENKARARLSVAEDQVARLAPLAKDGLVSEAALVTARGEIATAKADLDAAARSLAAWRASSSELGRATLAAAAGVADAEVADAEEILRSADVTAPTNGQLVDLRVHAGDSCDAGAVLATILLPEGRVVAFDVPPGCAPSIACGARAHVMRPDGRAIDACVASISTQAEADTGLVEVIVDPASPDPTLIPGVIVRGEIEVSRIDSAVLVPEAALIAAGGAVNVVRKDEQGLSHAVPVEVPGRHGGLAAVRGAVAPGDRVVTDGGYNLPDGTHLTERGE